MKPRVEEFSKKFVEDLLSFFGLNTEVTAKVNEDGIIEVDIPSTHMNGFLIGQHGDVLHSIQSLLAAALIAQDYEQHRINVDVAEYKKQRAERLAEQARQWAEQVIQTGQLKELRPMNAADRRIVHQVAAASGLVSDSVGDGRDRHIVLKPAS